MATVYRTKFLVSCAVLAVTILLQAAPALASCTYHNYMINGRYVSCTVCCYGAICNTTCY